MCQPQRCVVASPSTLAMPFSSPAGHGGAGDLDASPRTAADSNAAVPAGTPTHSMALTASVARWKRDRFIANLLVVRCSNRAAAIVRKAARRDRGLVLTWRRARESVARIQG